MSKDVGKMRDALPVLLDRHREALAGCRRCGHLDVLPIVSTARAPRAMLVGQAPGQVEARGGRPFAGRAGKTLFQWLARAGISEARARESIHIAAVTRCYPGPHPAGRGDRVPSPRERALCRSWLDDELRIIAPTLVIPVGRLAIDTLMGAEPLDRLVGRAHDVELAGVATRLVPLPHPSGASSWVHEPGHRALLERALGLLGAELAALGLADLSDGRETAA